MNFSWRSDDIVSKASGHRYSLHGEQLPLLWGQMNFAGLTAFSGVPSLTLLVLPSFGFFGAVRQWLIDQKTDRDKQYLHISNHLNTFDVKESSTINFLVIRNRMTLKGHHRCSLPTPGRRRYSRVALGRIPASPIKDCPGRTGHRKHRLFPLEGLSA